MSDSAQIYHFHDLDTIFDIGLILVALCVISSYANITSDTSIAVGRAC